MSVVIAYVLAIGACRPALMKVLPLGDSITFGCGSNAEPGGNPDCADDAGGYRVPLMWSLSSAFGNATNVTTVGTLSNGPNSSPSAWLNHEGHPGLRIGTCSVANTLDLLLMFHPFLA
jgi:hypothetical protein